MEPILTTSVTRHSVIFEAEVESAQQVAGCPAGLRSGIAPSRGVCKTNVLVRVVRVLRGPEIDGQGPVRFRAEVAQWFGSHFDQPYFWTGREVHVGQRYIVLGSQKGGLGAIFGSPDDVELIDDEVDAVGDVALVLHSMALPIDEQASAVALALQSAIGTHSRFLADYAAALLEADTGANALALGDAIVNAGDHTFSDNAKENLLFRLYSAARMASAGASGMVTDVFADLTAKYFADRPGGRAVGLTRIQRQVLDNYLQWIRGAGPVMSALRTRLQPAAIRDLRLTGSRLLVDASLSDVQRVQVRELIAIFGANPVQ
jgi:hypothetical protein